MSVWITEHEKDVTSKLAQEFENNLMFGTKNNELWERQSMAKSSLQECMSSGLISLKRYLQLIKLAESKDLDNVNMVLKILNAKANDK